MLKLIEEIKFYLRRENHQFNRGVPPLAMVSVPTETLSAILSSPAIESGMRQARRIDMDSNASAGSLSFPFPFVEQALSEHVETARIALKFAENVGAPQVMVGDRFMQAVDELHELAEMLESD